VGISVARKRSAKKTAFVNLGAKRPVAADLALFILAGPVTLAAFLKQVLALEKFPLMTECSDALTRFDAVGLLVERVSYSRYVSTQQGIIQSAPGPNGRAKGVLDRGSRPTHLLDGRN